MINNNTSYLICNIWTNILTEMLISREVGATAQGLSILVRHLIFYFNFFIFSTWETLAVPQAVGSGSWILGIFQLFRLKYFIAPLHCSPDQLHVRNDPPYSLRLELGIGIWSADRSIYLINAAPNRSFARGSVRLRDGYLTSSCPKLIG